MTEPLDEKGLPDPNDAARWNAEAEAHALETLRTSQGLAASPSPSMEMEVVASLRKQAAEEVKEWNDNWRLPSVEAARSAEDSHLWKAADIIVSLSAQVLRISEENEALRKERDEAQANAYRSDKAADALNVAVKDAGDRAAAMWRQFRDLRTEIIGDGPMCRDCADFDGRCQGNGPPCDPDEAAKEKLATWKAAEARIKALEEALREIRELNTTGADENGHRWSHSDLIDQVIIPLLRAPTLKENAP